MTLFRFEDKSQRYSFTHIGIIEVNFNNETPYWNEDGSPVPIDFDEFKKLVKKPKLTEQSFLKACESVRDQDVDIGCQQGFIVNGMLIIRNISKKHLFMVIYDEFPESPFSLQAERFFSLYRHIKKYDPKRLAPYDLFLKRAKKIPWLRDRISEYIKEPKRRERR